MNIQLRKEHITDKKAIAELHTIAFGQDEEARIVDQIRNDTHGYIPELSLVALMDDKVIGHILLSCIKLIQESDSENSQSDSNVESLALAPMAVLPDYQRMGIGSQLVREALSRAEKQGFESVIVLGHADYYPEFGFRPASEWNIRCPFDVPDEAFMALELKEGSLHNIRAVVHYPESFST